MKTIEPRTVALLTALAIGFGLAFHKLFLVVAAGVVLLAVAQRTGNELRKFLIDFRSKHNPLHSRSTP